MTIVTDSIVGAQPRLGEAVGDYSAFVARLRANTNETAQP